MHFHTTHGPTFHRILLNKLCNPCIPVMQDFMPRSRPVCGSRWADHTSKQFSEYHINIVEVIFENRPVPCSKQATGVIPYQNIEIKLPTTHVGQSRSIGLHEMPVKPLEDGNQRLHDGTLQDGAPEPFVWRSTVKNIHRHPTTSSELFWGWACVVKILLFLTFNVKPTSASEATSSSNKRHVLSIYEPEIFQCLRVSSGLFWKWSPYPVQETTLCT